MIRLKKNDPQPLYLQIKEGLRREIAAGRFRADEPIPCERTLAAQLGLNRLTVRRAFTELTREGLLERIPGRGTFLKAPVRARGSTSKASGAPASPATTIGIVGLLDRVDPHDSLFYYRILQSVHRSCDAQSRIVCRRVVEPHGEFAAALAREPGLDGLIVMSLTDAALLRALAAARLPAVFVDCAPFEAPGPFDVISYATEESSCRAVTSLLQLGHRDIGMVVHAAVPAEEAVTDLAHSRAEVGPVARERLRGYERAFREHGLPVPEDLVFPVVPCTACAYAAMRRILKRPRAPTAVFCSTDEMALGIISAVKDHGWRVPEHLSVIGFGDLGHFCTPPLSSVHMPLEPVGEAAVRFLRERLAEPDLPPRTWQVPTEFIPRASCDIPREEEAARP
jgi:DNA-binding LacI/PurR family transcriptional regulator